MLYQTTLDHNAMQKPQPHVDETKKSPSVLTLISAVIRHTAWKSVENIRKLSSSAFGGSFMWCLSHRSRFLNERRQRISTLLDQQRCRYAFEFPGKSSSPNRHVDLPDPEDEGTTILRNVANYRGADESLARPDWKKTIERSPFFVRRGSHCCRGDLVGRTTFWSFFEWLAKVWVWSL